MRKTKDFEKQSAPSWAVRVPQPPRQQFDRATERSIIRSIKRQAEGRWNGKGDPKAAS